MGMGSMTAIPQATPRRVYVVSSVIAALILAGIVLYFAFGHVAEPLLEPLTRFRPAT